MSIFQSLSQAERARQLANPEGDVGLAVAEWLNDANRKANEQAVAMLRLEPGCRVLEIGFGNGRTVPDIVAQADGVHYTGIDLSPTMVEEAERFNAALVASGRAGFHLGTADHLPFPDAGFDRIFSTGVIHFWREPAASLAELRRVARPGARILMACLDAKEPAPFRTPEFGFFLRTPAEWESLFQDAGFPEVEARGFEVEQIAPDGTPMRRYMVCVVARA